MDIVVRLKGGTGNQMFQYAMGRAVQLSIPGASLVLDNTEVYKDAFRPYGLTAFDIPNDVNVIQDSKNNKYSRKYNPVIRIAMKLCPRLLFHILSMQGVFIWDEDSYIVLQIKKQNRKHLFFSGYWQSEKYFKRYKEDILNDFSFTLEVRKQNPELADAIKQTNSVCVHIRLGDYLTKKNQEYQVCTAEDYVKAIHYIESTIDDPVFFVFSDEVDIARDALRELEGPRVFFVDGEYPDYVDLYLMSQCKHFIMSNSSFSWWAQYLSASQDKIVIAPQRWKRTEVSRDIYMDSWTILP